MKSTNFSLKSNPRKKSHKKLLAVLLILLLVVAAGGAALVRKNILDNRKVQEEKTRNEAQTDSAKKDVENNKANSSPADAEAASQTTDQVPTTSNYSVTIAAFSQEDRMVRASAKITGSGNGMCVFSYTNPEDKPVVQQVTSANGACSSSVSEVKFNRLGSWNLSVMFYANNTKAEANQSVTIK